MHLHSPYPSPFISHFPCPDSIYKQKSSQVSFRSVLSYNFSLSIPHFCPVQYVPSPPCTEEIALIKHISIKMFVAFIWECLFHLLNQCRYFNKKMTYFQTSKNFQSYSHAILASTKLKRLNRREEVIIEFIESKPEIKQSNFVTTINKH